MQWKDVVGFEDYYEVSNTGIIKSKARKLNRKDGKKMFKRAFELHPAVDPGGYLRTMFCIDLKNTTVKVHRIVAEAWVKGKTKKRNEVNHKDGIKQNNEADNLEWVTHAENCQHSYDMGLQKPRRGSTNNLAKLTESDIPKIRQLFKDGWSSRKIAALYNMDKTVFLDIKNGKLWTHVHQDRKTEGG